MIELKTPAEIERMRRAGRVVAELLEALGAMLKPGLRTKDLDDAALAFLKAQGAKPAFLGYRGFPACICVSVNEEVVHGIPGDRQLRAGDLVSLDAGAVIEGFYADAAVTRWIGSVPAQAQRLVETTRQALEEGIAQAVEGKRLADISQAVQRVVESAKFGIVREFVGHGIGRALHEDPPIPNFVPVGVNPRLRAGMVLAIEPMVTMGRHEVEVLSDGWTAVTRDRSLAAHWEHTVAVTSGAPDILTRLPGA